MNRNVYVYVAGPYTAASDEGVLENVNKAIDVGNVLMDYGLNVYVPHLSHYMHARKAREYEAWMKMDFAWLDKCQALYRIAGNSSTDREVEYAQRKGLPVFYCLPGLLKWFGVKA